MTSRGLRFQTAAAVVLLLVGAGCSGSIDKAGGHKPRPVRVLHVVHTRGADEAQPFVDKAADLSGGALRLSVDNRPKATSTDSEIDAIRAVQAGKADLAVVSVRPWHALGVNSFDALIAPLGIDSMALQRKVLASEIPKHMLAGLEHVGLDGIGLLPGPMRIPGGITRPLVTRADYAGARIGFGRSAVAERSLRALGAIPIDSPFEGTSISAYDGIEQQVSSVAGNQYDGVVQSVTVNVNLWPRTLVVIGNPKALAGLPQHERNVLRSAAADAVDAVSNAQMDTELVDVMCRRGKIELITATAAQLAQLRVAFVPVYSWLRQDPATARYLDQIDTLRAGVTPYPRESLSCAGIIAPDVPPAVVTPIDGVYQVTMTAAELHAAGSPDTLPENYGTYRWVLNRGWWEETQHSDKASTWAHGHYTVKGDVLTLSADASGGIAPSGAEAKPGDSSTLRWSRYRYQLSIRAANSALIPSEYPLSYTVNPWRRLGDAVYRPAPIASMPSVPARPPASTSAPNAVHRTSPLDGAYELRLSAADLLAVGADGEELVPENEGVFRLVLRHGRFAVTQHQEPACTWAYGTFLVQADHLRLIYSDGGGISPNRATNKPGEIFDYRWSVYRDSMRWSALPNAVSPAGWAIRPWMLLSKAASGNFLDPKCPPPPGALTG